MLGNNSVGAVNLDVKLNSRAAEKQLSGIASSLGKKLAIGLSGISFGAFTKKCLDLGSDLAEVQNVVDVTFGSMSGSVNKWSKDAAMNFGLSETMAKRYVGTFGSMAEAFGFSEKEAYDMSTTLTGLAGDVASFYNISQDAAYTKLKSVFSGETESLKDLGIVMTQANLDQYALANGFGKTTSAMTEAEKVSLRYAFVQSQLANATGDFARTSDSWANQTRLLSLQIESLMANIGQGLIAALSPVIRALNTFMGKLVQASEVFSSFMSKVFGGAPKKLVSSMKGMFSDSSAAATAAADKTTSGLSGMDNAASSAASSMDNLGDSSGSTSKAAKKAAKDLKKAQRELLGFDKITKLASKQKSEKTSGDSGVSGLSGGGGSIGGGSGAVGGISKQADDANKSLSKIKIPKKLAKSLSHLKKSFGTFFGIIKSAGKWAWDNVLKPLGKWTISELAPAVIELLASAFDVLNAVLEALEPVWKWLWKNFFKPLAKFTGKLVIKALGLIAAAFNKIAGFAEKHPKAFRAIVVSLLGLLAIKKISPVLSLVSGKFKLFGRAISIFGKGNGLKGFGKLCAVLFKRTKLFAKFASVAAKFKKVGTILKRFGSLAAKGFKLVGTALTAHPVVAILVGIAAAALLIWKNWDKIKKTKFGKFLISVGNSLKKVWDKLKKVGDYLKEKFLGAIDKAKAAIQAFKDIWGNIESKAVDLVANAKEKVDGAIDKIKAGWEAIENKTAELKAEVKQKWDDLKDKWLGITDNIKDKAAGMKAEVASKWDDLKDKWLGITDNVKGKTAKMKAKIASKWKDLKASWNSLRDKFKGKTATFKAVCKNALGKKWEAVKKAWGSIKDKTATLTATLKAKASAAWNAAATRLNDAKRKHPKLLGWLPELPYLAQGGFVERNTPQLAVIGDNRREGEIVSPESKLQAMANQAARMSGGSRDDEIVALLRMLISEVRNLDTSVYMDGEKITKKVVGNINQKTRATGKSPILL